MKREFETEKGDVGLDEYETRSWAGWHHHIAMCLLGGAVPAEPDSRSLGWKKMPRITYWLTIPVSGVVREIADPGSSSMPDQLLLWLEEYAATLSERARRSHERLPLHPPRKQDGAATLNPSL